MYVAIGCLCNEGQFIDRLEIATISALGMLNYNDLTGELAEDLKFILALTIDNLKGGKIQRVPTELERSKLIEKMLHIIIETSRQK